MLFCQRISLFSRILSYSRGSSFNNFRLFVSDKNNNYNFYLDPSTFEEKFVRGSGPGGQSINKSKNCVQIKHIPSGISVNCQEARDLTSNRKMARTLLTNKLEFAANGQDSKIGRRIARIRRRKYNAARRARAKYDSTPSDHDGMV